MCFFQHETIWEQWICPPCVHNWAWRSPSCHVLHWFSCLFFKEVILVGVPCVSTCVKRKCVSQEKCISLRVGASTCLPSFTYRSLLKSIIFPQHNFDMLYVFYFSFSSNNHRNKYRVDNPFNCAFNFVFGRIFYMHFVDCRPVDRWWAIKMTLLNCTLEVIF